MKDAPEQGGRLAQRKKVSAKEEGTGDGCSWTLEKREERKRKRGLKTNQRRLDGISGKRNRAVHHRDP